MGPNLNLLLTSPTGLPGIVGGLVGSPQRQRLLSNGGHTQSGVVADVENILLSPAADAAVKYVSFEIIFELRQLSLCLLPSVPPGAALWQSEGASAQNLQPENMIHNIAENFEVYFVS